MRITTHHAEDAYVEDLTAPRVHVDARVPDAHVGARVPDIGKAPSRLSAECTDCPAGSD